MLTFDDLALVSHCQLVFTKVTTPCVFGIYAMWYVGNANLI